jgi:NADP-dependent 3-hydroxy acid dehydrogenase YdfG
MKILVIVGAGKGLGLSIAKRFGKEGFQVALVARNVQKLKSMVDELKGNGVEASYFVADISKKAQIEKALADARAKYDRIDVVEFSANPMTGNYPPTSVLELTAENARDHFEGQVVSAINIVNNVVPEMIARGEGALLFTSGLTAVYPILTMSNIGIAMAGLRNYVANLHTALSPKGILVAHRSLGVWIRAGTGAANDPDVIAEMWYQVYAGKKDGDDVYPTGVTLATVVM